MAETAAYPYATHLDIKFDPLTLFEFLATELSICPTT